VNYAGIAADSAVYDNISGADQEQIYQFIDTLPEFRAVAGNLLGSAGRQKSGRSREAQSTAPSSPNVTLQAENFAESEKVHCRFHASRRSSVSWSA